jgi:hypothetical protein
LPEKLVSRLFTAVLKSIIFALITLVYVKPLKFIADDLLALAAMAVNAAANSDMCSFFTVILLFKVVSV